MVNAQAMFKRHVPFLGLQGAVRAGSNMAHELDVTAQQRDVAGICHKQAPLLDLDCSPQLFLSEHIWQYSTEIGTMRGPCSLRTRQCRCSGPVGETRVTIPRPNQHTCSRDIWHNTVHLGGDLGPDLLVCWAS